MDLNNSRLELKHLFGGIAKNIKGETLPFRKLADFELVIMLEGSATYIADSAHYQVPQGGLIIARPGTVEKYHWDTKQQSRHGYFHFSIKSMPPDWPPLSHWPRLITKPSVPSLEIFKHILIHIKKHPEWCNSTPSRCVSSLIEVFLDLCFKKQEPPLVDFKSEFPESLQRSIKWMREHFEDKPEVTITLAMLAEVAHVSENYLCRLFQQNLKISPMQAVKFMRLQLGLSLLLRSKLNIKEIAFRCGFNDPFYFSRIFSKTYGSSPSAIRKNVLEGKPLPSIPDISQLLTRVYW